MSEGRAWPSTPSPPGWSDEVQLFVFPIVVGGGKPGLPRGLRVDLELLDERRFGSGVVHVRYGRR